MARMTSGVGAMAGSAEGAARAAAHEAAPWLVRGARLGYAAKGAVYIVVGLLALQAAVGGSGQTTGKQGALQTIADEPGGGVILGLLAVGLFGYAAWRLVEAVTDAERKGRDAKGLAVRGAHAVYGVIYGALGLEAARLATGAGAGGGAGTTGGGDGAVHWTARLLALPFGRALVIGAGVWIAGYGVGQLVRAFRADVRRHLDLSDVSPATQTWIVRLGRLGHAARGVVFGIVGWFLVRAAMTYDPQQAGGLGEALGALQAAPYGAWLLGLVAAGLVAYGLFQVVHARYRVIRAT